MRATGANPAAAEYGGVSIRKQIILAHGDFRRTRGHGRHQRSARLSSPLL
jgi:hypothetical protein